MRDFSRLPNLARPVYEGETYISAVADTLLNLMDRLDKLESTLASQGQERGGCGPNEPSMTPTPPPAVGEAAASWPRCWDANGPTQGRDYYYRQQTASEEIMLVSFADGEERRSGFAADEFLRWVAKGCLSRCHDHRPRQAKLDSLPSLVGTEHLATDPPAEWLADKTWATEISSLRQQLASVEVIAREFEYDPADIATDLAGCIRGGIARLQKSIAEGEDGIERLKGDYKHACCQIAKMHAAAVGEVTGPKRGVVEDVEDVRGQLLNVMAGREQAICERDGWMETAAQHLRNEEFYRGLIHKIGEPFGIAAKTSGDGSIQEDVLALKVPELVDSLRQQLADAEEARDAAGYLLGTVADKPLKLEICQQHLSEAHAATVTARKEAIGVRQELVASREKYRECWHLLRNVNASIKWKVIKDWLAANPLPKEGE